MLILNTGCCFEYHILQFIQSFISVQFRALSLFMCQLNIDTMRANMHKFFSFAIRAPGDENVLYLCEFMCVCVCHFCCCCFFSVPKWNGVKLWLTDNTHAFLSWVVNVSLFISAYKIFFCLFFSKSIEVDALKNHVRRHKKMKNNHRSVKFWAPVSYTFASANHVHIKIFIAVVCYMFAHSHWMLLDLMMLRLLLLISACIYIFCTSGVTLHTKHTTSHERHFNLNLVVVFRRHLHWRIYACKNLCEKINKISNCFEQHIMRTLSWHKDRITDADSKTERITN